MKRELSNAIYGVLDYLAYPLGMLAIAPITLREFGNERFGIWIFAGTAINIGAIAASGFGDANIRVVAMRKANGDPQSVLRAVRSTMGIHVILGGAMTIIAWFLAPLLTAHLISNLPALRNDCVWSLRLAAIMIFLRAVESVCVSTQRAYERYGAAVGVSVAARLASLIAAATLPMSTHSVFIVLAATCVLSGLGVSFQLAQLGRLLHTVNLLPTLERETSLVLLTFGVFAWVQAVSGLVFGQLDRLLAGLTFGAAAVTAYSLCVQLCQPIYGVAAAGLHFIFPRIATHLALDDNRGARRAILVGVCANVLIVCAGTAVVLLFGHTILRAWGGKDVARMTASILPVIAWSTALAGLAVAGSYSLLALGKVRILTCITLTAGAVMLGSMSWLAPRHGLDGLAWGRMLYGPITCIVYIPLLMFLSKRPSVLAFQAITTALTEEAS
jgi:O-antigen/teichoic acid export membrane protein